MMASDFLKEGSKKLRRMGACLSVDNDIDEIKIVLSKDNVPKKDLNPADYRCSQLKGEVVVKKPGDVNGVQFLVEDCSDTQVFLVDKVGPIAMDNCKGCTVICGPSDSSVFIRDCSDCDVVVGCQQLRLRDCKNMRIFLHSQTGPIIESSSNIRFGCYSYDYFGITKHFKEHGFYLLKNLWFSVYDFTPAVDYETCNHSLLEPSIDHSELFGPSAPPSLRQAWDVLSAEGLAPPLQPPERSVPLGIPRSSGPTFATNVPGKSAFLCALAKHEDALCAAMSELGLVQGTCAALSDAQMLTLYAMASRATAVPEPLAPKSFFAKPPKAERVRPALMLVVCTEGDLREVLDRHGVPSGEVCVVQDEAKVEEATRLVFEVWTKDH